MKIYICKPDIQHFFQKFPKDFIHQIHKWSLGIILVEHKEPNGKLTSKIHKDYVLFRII